MYILIVDNDKEKMLKLKKLTFKKVYKKILKYEGYKKEDKYLKNFQRSFDGIPINYYDGDNFGSYFNEVEWKEKLFKIYKLFK